MLGATYVALSDEETRALSNEEFRAIPVARVIVQAPNMQNINSQTPTGSASSIDYAHIAKTASVGLLSGGCVATVWATQGLFTIAAPTTVASAALPAGTIVGGALVCMLAYNAAKKVGCLEPMAN
ncbi:MAG: hypothetical protein Q7V63_09365 [Gammaproteobacteria bacterium]|nr:hypothetical protein [Gammaproteobacteria bacterium]